MLNRFKNGGGHWQSKFRYPNVNKTYGPNGSPLPKLEMDVLDVDVCKICHGHRVCFSYFDFYSKWAFHNACIVYGYLKFVESSAFFEYITFNSYRFCMIILTLFSSADFSCLFMPILNSLKWYILAISVSQLVNQSVRQLSSWFCIELLAGWLVGWLIMA